MKKEPWVSVIGPAKGVDGVTDRLGQTASWREWLHQNGGYIQIYAPCTREALSEVMNGIDIMREHPEGTESKGVRVQVTFDTTIEDITYQFIMPS